MSAICHGFVQNTWRKDHCTNCFRMREEHEEIGNSVIENNATRSGKNFVNNSPIVPSNNANFKSGNEAESPEVKISQRVNRFLGANNSSSTTSLSSSGTSGSSSSIPRMNSGTAINQIGKISGTNNNNSSSSASVNRGHVSSVISNNNSASNHDYNDSNLTGTNGKVKSTETVMLLLPKSSSSSLSSSKPPHPHPQGKGIMTNSHPSKSDNASVIPPTNHHNHNKLSMTCSAPATIHQQSSSSSSSGGGNTTTISTATGRHVSTSFIASKNIFNNATTSSSNSNTIGLGSTSSSSAAAATTASSSSGSTTVITAPLLPPSATGSTGCVNGTVVVAVASNAYDSAAAASSGSSSCLSHSPQSATSFKRGNIVSSSSSSSSSNSQHNLLKSGNISSSGGGGGVVVDFPSSCISNGSGTSHHLYQSKNFENHAKNGLIEKWEFCSEGVSNNNTTVGSNSSGGGVVSCGKVAITLTSSQNQQSAMNNSKGKVLRPMDSSSNMEGENLDRRKAQYSSSTSTTSNSANANNHSVYVGGEPIVDSSAKMGKSSKGILRNKGGAKRREKNVRFPEEVVEVIGYGGGPSGVSDDEDDSPPDPLDSASVNEVMEKNSTTFEEKELHRLTQKNTNFNSIKTNLLGTTCIEIGPIVGCTGGKSMEGSSKPLVSIGTFETRKEPLRISKKISEDSADDELNEKTVEKHRKFIPRSSVSSASSVSTVKTQSSTQQASKIATMISNTANKESTEAKHQHTTVTTLSLKNDVKMNTTSSAFNSTTNTSKTSSISSSGLSSGKSSSSISNKSASSTSSFESKGNGLSAGSAATTIEVNPEQSSSVSRMMSKSSSNSSTVTSNRIITNSSSNSVIASSSASVNSKWSGGNNNASNNNDNSLRNKPVLKRIQQKNMSAESGEACSTDNRPLTVNGTINCRNNTNSNLIILTNGEKNNKINSVVVGGTSGSSIASKRNSFLRDIIVDSSTTTTMENSAGGKEINQSSATGSSNTSGSGGVQVICKNSNNDPDSLIKSELKVDLKPSVHNGKLSHPPFGECLSNRSNGTDDSSEFDDSLEDSGLDIKKCSEISESDEKSGSGSDSGNENDYSDRDRMKIIPGAGPKSGLFISVDEVEEQNKKPEKLSPDSVLFSSASEMSASGSSESIPEALDTVGRKQKNSASSSSTSGNESGGSSSASPTSAATKRTAPRPPTSAPPDIPKEGAHAIYANSSTTITTTAQATTIVDVEGLYDDVSFYKNPMHFPPSKDSTKISTFEEVDEEEEENIYDDCTVLAQAKAGKSSNGGKSAMGSYNFQNGSHNNLDSDGDEDTEKVVHRRSDGIEFIGIRKIDSESFLRERSPTPERNPEGKRERSSSASPKTRRRVNQFFSTIGKKAGAAFSQHVHGYSNKNKSSPVIEDSGIDSSPSGKSSSAYKRSLSTDEVSMTRTQEIYATLTPTSLKFKGLAPVLHKLSKIDLNLGDKDKGDYDDDRLDSKEKGFKKHKISSSIKKFLRFGSKDGESSGNKYDFGNTSSGHKTDPSQMMKSQISEESISTDSNPSRTPTPTMANTQKPLKLPERKPSYGTISGRPPPPPPPRVHSLDLLNRVGVVGPNGTVRPARPPPPSRHNRVAPSFTAVFNNPNGESEAKANASTSSSSSSSHDAQPSQNTNNNNNNGELPDPNNPPSKPKRKASMNLDCVTNGISRDLETTYNHITTLNLETLKLIASQTPTKIRRSNPHRRSSPLKWSHFQILDSARPIIQGQGFVFYSAMLDDESCILLVQETATAPNFSAPFEFSCVDTSATFEDCIPDSFITWKASEYVTNGSNVRVFVSVMPKYSMYTVEGYMRHSQVPLLHKYFALLQAMNYWDKEDMSELLVLVQSMEEPDSHFSRADVPQSSSSSSPSSVLVYVHPIPHLSTSNQLKTGGKRSSSKTQIYDEFESAMKHILLNNGSDGITPLLGDNDRHVLLKRLNENKTKTAQDQFRLFLQVKLFAPKRDSDELERIKKLRSERAIQQWLDRERALCMKEAVEQTLQRNIESSISPYKRSYLEFLLTPENSAKAVLEMLIDLLE